MSVLPGALNGLADVAGIRIGHAGDKALRSGVTVLGFERAMACAVDVRGGGPATRETDAVALGATLGIAHGLVFSGGSVFGLGAADHVAAQLSARGEGLVLREGTPAVPIIPAACIYDLANGGSKDWGATPPYAALAAQALAAMGEGAEVGSVGAGMGAMAGAWRGGLGQASLSLEDGATVAALIVANPVGSPVMPDGRTLWAWPFERAGEFGGGKPADDVAALDPLPLDIKPGTAPGQATCVGAVAVSCKVSRTALHRIAVMAQDGLARAIRPSHAPLDGDTLFALAPEYATETDPRVTMQLGAVAADCVARAVGRGVWNAADDMEGFPSLRIIL